MKLSGNPVSKGIAIAPAYRYTPMPKQISESHISESEKQVAIESVKAAFTAVDGELQKLISSFSLHETEEAAIFSAHREILRDEELYMGIEQRILQDAMAPDYAIEACVDEFIDMLSSVKDETIRLRTADMKDVCNRLLRCLHGGKEGGITCLKEKCILITRDLLPSDTATMDKAHILGIVTELGGSTSHTAILARSYGIPALVGTTGILEDVQAGDVLILDALAGELIVRPTNEEMRQALEKQEHWRSSKLDEESFKNKDAVTMDGTRILIGQNIGSDQDEISDGADFIGLFRTEFLYMNSDHMPTEGEQFAAYSRVMKQANGRMVTLRTLDIGGDKRLSYLALPVEENPFLGMRGVRLCFDREDILRTQLRAALRASVYGSLGILIPMIDGVQDVLRVKQVLHSVIQSLDEQNIPYGHDYKLGVMIETPAAALIADDLAREVDFASIGSNDLCQYTHAVDRMNASVASYYQVNSKAMLRLMQMVVQAFDHAGKPISLCGELGGDPQSTALLTGLGLRKLSMNSSSIAAVKCKLSDMTIEEARKHASEEMK